MKRRMARFVIVAAALTIIMLVLGLPPLLIAEVFGMAIVLAIAAIAVVLVLGGGARAT